MAGPVDEEKTLGSSGPPRRDGSREGDRPPAGDATIATPGQKPGFPAPPGLAEGSVIAERYRVVRFIARGGMGEVYEAEDLALGGRVALKTILPSLEEGTEYVERFKREIHVARHVTHPNVCRIYDLGVHRGAPPVPGGPAPPELLFLTMELLHGTTLSERLRYGPMTTTEALPLVVQMAAGLHAAHEAGVVHRDFKSANVMLVPPQKEGRPPRVVITDFGLARPAASSESLASISDAGSVLGTPAYMAPEQVAGRPATPAADLYALGVVVYEMVTGTRPFDGPSPFLVAARRLTEPPPPPSLHVADLDPAWEEAILRCLKVDPAERFPSATDFSAALGGEAVRFSGSAFHRAAPGTATVFLPKAAARSRSRLAARVALAFLGVAVVVGGARAIHGPWGRPGPALPAAAAPTPAPAVRPARRSVAILGLKVATPGPDASWLPTALGELLATQLGAGEELRLVPASDVREAERGLGWKAADSVPGTDLGKLRAALGADLLVAGSCSVTGDGPARLARLEVEVLDARTGAAVGSSATTGSETHLVDLVSRAGHDLRVALGLPEATPAQALGVEASFPASPAAQRRYAEGLAQLRLPDPPTAKATLEKAVALEPKHPMPRTALAEAWSALGYADRARAEARQAAADSAALPDELRLGVEARLHEAAKAWTEAATSYQALLDRHPDDLDSGLRLAAAQVFAGKTNAALVTIEALRKLPAPLRDDARIDLAEARARQEQNDFRKQADLAAAGAAKARASGDRLLLARARMLESTALRSLGDAKGSDAAVDEARSLYEAVSDRNGSARALEQMSISVFGRGDLEGSRRLLEKAVDLYRQTGDKAGSARAGANLGNVLLSLGRVAEAERMYDESLKTFRSIGATHEAAASLNSIGVAFIKRGDLRKARERTEEAVSLWSGIGRKAFTALALSNLGEIERHLGNPDEARKLHEEALALNREVGEKAGVAFDLLQLAEVFLAKGDLVVTRQRAQESAALQQELGDRLGTAETKLLAAKAFLAEGKPSEAAADARVAEEVFRSEGASDRQAHALAALAEALARQALPSESASAAAGARAAAGSSGDFRAGLVAETAEGWSALAAAQTDPTAAAVRFDAAAARAAKAGFVALALEARLASLEARSVSTKPSELRPLAEALARDASAKGFGLVARKAAVLSGNSR
ncbi:MAG: protein kinase [Thermoanaerobaculia bacterium]